MRKARYIGPAIKTVQSMQEIQAVIDSCHDAAADNPYAVIVPPGIWDEQITMRDYVSLRGAGRGSTIISFATSSEPVLWYASNSIISNISIKNLHSSGGWGVSAQQNTENTIFDNCYIFAHADIMRSQDGGQHNTNMTVYNSELAGCYDGIMIAGTAKFFDTKINITNCDGSANRTAGIFPDDDLTAEFYNCDFDIRNNQSGVSSRFVAVYYNGSGDGHNDISFYNCKLNAKQVGTAPAYGIFTHSQDEVNIYGGSLRAFGFGTVHDLNNDSNGTLNVYGTKYETSSGVITGDTKIPGSLNVGTTTHYTNNTAALAGGLVAGDFYRTTDALKVVH